MLSRETIIDHLAARLADDADIRALAVAGADANGRADERSDIDLLIVVAPGRVEAAIAALEAAVTELSPIRIDYRLPLPTPHGCHQGFWQLERAEEWTMVDWLIGERDQPAWRTFLEVERHGAPRVLFDRDGAIVPVALDRSALARTLERRVAELRLRVPLFRHAAVKLVDRGGGMPIDALHFYHGLVLRPLVDMLRIVHCPERHDFGLRYLKDDLPAPIYRELAPLFYPQSAAAIPELTARAMISFEAALAAWDRR